MITLQYFDTDIKEWVDVSKFLNESIAWMSLGDDNVGYRTVDEKGNVLTDKSVKL